MSKRIAVTVLAVAVGLAFVVAIFVRGNPRTAPTPAPTPVTPQQIADATERAIEGAAPAPPTDGAEAPSAPAPAEQVIEPAPEAAPATDVPAPALGALKPLPAEVAEVSTIGSLDPASDYVLQVKLSGWGASIDDITLTHYYVSALEKEKPDGEHYTVQKPVPLPGGYFLRPFAARAVYVNGQRIDLQSLRWRLDAPGQYSLPIVLAENDAPVLRIVRRYAVVPSVAGYDVRVEQRIENQTDKPLQVTWEQYAQADMPGDDAGGDHRAVVAGYYNLQYDPGRLRVFTDQTFHTRVSAVKELLKTNAQVWPDADLPQNVELTWLANTNRYFAAAVHPLVTEQGTGPAPALDTLFTRQWLEPVNATPNANPQDVATLFVLQSKPVTVAPGQAAQLDLSLYAGPRKREVFEQPPFSRLHLMELIRYELGCTWCTFQPIARGLLWFLKLIERVTFDWGIAIIVLVIIVRAILHPLTKKSQISMMKLGKQMQALQPEIEKLKKKFKDDQNRLQQETMRLYREKGVNPANMLGCAPMFLQMPIWVALYAMLYYAIELRHEPAFYNVFHNASVLLGFNWSFLADLSQPDNFIKVFSEPRQINLLFFHPFFQSVNLLPVLLAVVFYFQQKLMTPPPANEQAEQQQKIMKWMVLLFPVMLYSMPSGLNLYILASTFAGIVDSLIVKHHIKKEEEAGTLFAPKPVKPGGFWDRMNRLVEEKQRELTQRQQQHPKRPRKD